MSFEGGYERAVEEQARFESHYQSGRWIRGPPRESRAARLIHLCSGRSDGG